MTMFNSLIAVAALTAFSLPGLAADPVEHSHDHPPAKGAKKLAPSKASKEAMARMDARMMDMQEMHEKMMAAKTPDERSAMMAAQMKLMQDGMTMMKGMSSGGMAGMQGDMAMKKGSGSGMSHDMMEKRMDMMQAMMQMMMDRMPQAPAK